MALDDCIAGASRRSAVRTCGSTALGDPCNRRQFAVAVASNARITVTLI
jgi:hypothetical protein